jgi:hypothetical protein
MKDDRRTANIDPDILKLVFDRVSYHAVVLHDVSVLTRLLASRETLVQTGR